MFRQILVSHVTLVIAAVATASLLQEGYDLSPPSSASGYTYDAPKSKGLNINNAAGGRNPLSVSGGKSLSASGGNSLSASGGSGKSLSSLIETVPGGGFPGRDYPVLATVPSTGFSCKNQLFPGYYADTTSVSRCQVFHICQFDGRQDSFLCPNGTMFNQQYFVCDWWFNVDCSSSGQFFNLNIDIGKVSPTAGSTANTAGSGSGSGAVKPSGFAASGGSSGGVAGNTGVSGIPGSSSGVPGSSSGTQGIKVPSKPSGLYDLPEKNQGSGQGSEAPKVTKPSGLYGTPNEK